MNTETREKMYSYISDAHKDAYGFRPHGNMLAIRAMSDEELSRYADELSAAVCESIDRERAEQAKASVDFEAHIESLMNDHGIDRDTAIRWDREAEGITEEEFSFYGWSQYEFTKNLPYGYFAGKEI